MNDGKVIIDKIIADADESVKKILSEAQSAADAVIKEAEEKAAKERVRSDKVVADEKDKVSAKQISSAEMQAKKAVLARKQLILEKVVKAAEERLVNLPDAEYVQVIAQMLDGIDKKLGNEVIVAERDKARLAETVSAKGFTLSDKTADINGGLIIRNGDIEYNYSFGSIITIEKEEIQQIAAKILFE